MGLFSRNKHRSDRRKRQDDRGEDEGVGNGKAWAVLRLFQAAKGQRPVSPSAPGDLGRKPQLLLPSPAKHLAIPSLGEASGGGATVSAASASAGETDSRLFSNQNYRPRRMALRRSPDTPAEHDSSMLLPSTHPLCRYIAAARAPHNTNNSPEEEAKERELARYKLWQRERPRFRFGPRVAGQAGEEEEDPEESPGGGGEGDGGRRGSQGEESADTNIVDLPPKYAFIYQDGKFVEREVNRWPKHLRHLPQTRYRVQEPYASAYGKRYRKRVDAAEHIVSMRHRLIYQNPIYRLPRRIMEENKSRLMIRHNLKDSFEGSSATGGPQKIEVGEREQSKMIKKLQEKVNQKEAEKLVNYTTSRKAKQNES